MDTPLQNLAGCRVLLVEDEYLIADELGKHLSAHGAILLGAVPTLEKALALVEASERIDGAVIDINLRGQAAYPVADALEGRGVPFVFATGYSAAMLPDRYRHVPRWEKPYQFEALVQSLPALIHRS
ncbi:response regulator [Microvirga lotononidis]|uniref:Response regulatory domain-containing protein n=1 Tax=Microvirga lotononidis TaxID=864069 RepID=I4YS20_9HYPH|nr:response regulator [Microvirga lotononidis]EIM26762.1 hypothetical protein MicloDRAFT_00033120 [Microvirga lotononidis]WQO31672.1 response regulator [Microvirga lotononidis]